MERLARIIAMVGGIGRIPVAPGTCASVASAAVWSLVVLSGPMQWAVGCVTVAIGVWAAGRLAKSVAQTDPPQVVIDEWAGMWLALAGLPKTVPVIVAAVAAFRLLDILKPPPIKQLERLPGGWGIMLDDVAAGLIVRVAAGLLLPLH